MKIFIARYCSLSREVVRWTISRQALLRMLLLSQTWTILQCAFVVATVFNFCFSACHEGDFGQYMNSRRVHEDTDSGDTDHTVRSFWDRFIDIYITMFLNFMEACKGVNNCMLTSLPYCIPYYGETRNSQAPVLADQTN